MADAIRLRAVIVDDEMLARQIIREMLEHDPERFLRDSGLMERWTAGSEGALAADALAMPVHWYYDRAALQRDGRAAHPELARVRPAAGSAVRRSRSPREGWPPRGVS